MFYDRQSREKQEDYKKKLKVMGSLSRLFSNSESPYLYYRAHENIFSKYFDVDNNSRSDDSVDAYNNETGIGIGLKTWVGGDDQKVAEFGRLRPEYEHLTGLELVQRIAEYRNLRIKTTMNAHGLSTILYHIVKRVPNAMHIYEAAFDEIDIPNISLISDRGNNNNTYFTDGRHTYHFSRSKNTLFMIFDNIELLDTVELEIYSDPYDVLSDLMSEISPTVVSREESQNNKLCLRLYSTDRQGRKSVPPRSGINQWNARGRQRNPDEIYIPYPAVDRIREEFFPSRDTPFNLQLPDGTSMEAKVCQQDGKAIMSNPNRVLGNWLLRKVFELEEGTIVTYEMLKKFNVDCVIFTKLGERKYSVDFGELGTYEKFYNIDDNEENTLA